MTDSIPTTNASEAVEPIARPTNFKPLRWWPAALLVVLMVVLRFLPKMMESPSIGVFMVAFMGPAGVGAVILLWWLAASRATWKERLIGFLAIIAIAVACSMYLDKTMQGMATMLFVVPSGFAAFAIALSIFAKNPMRLAIALQCALVGFGVWNLFQSSGVTGKFETEFDWRWRKTGEQKYLEARSKMPTTPATSNASVVPAITLAASEWSAFRGQSRDGKLSGVSLAEDWSTNPPKKIWLRPIGPAWSSFAVAGKYIFTQEQRDKEEAVVCIDADTGNVVWDHEYTARFWEALAGAGPRATPTIADEGLFTTGADGIVSCLNASTGKELWHADLKDDAFRDPPMWGFSASPLVVDGLAIVHAGGKSDFGVFAYDAKTGEQRWSSPSGDHSYSSPQLATFDGVQGVLMSTNTGLQFLSPVDGKKIWEHEWPVENYRAIQPLVIGNSILIGTSLGGGTRRITVTKDNETWSIKEDWTSKDMKPDFNDFVAHEGYLYGFDGNIFCCINLADGKRQWKKGRYGNGQVLLLSDAGQMLVTSEKGELVLLKADPEKMVELAKFQAIEGKTWNHSVVVGNRVYIRNSEQAACYELPTK